MPQPDPDIRRDAEADLSISRAILVLALICALRLIIGAVLYDPPRVWFHADDYCRSIMAINWLKAPFWYPHDLHWLPLPFYLHGLASGLGPSVERWPFVLVSQAGMLLSTIGMYVLSRAFFSRLASLIATYLHAVTAWVAVMSYSALAEPVYYPLMIFGFAAYARWWRGTRPIHLFTACLLFTLAAAARYEAWLFIVIVGLVTLGRLVVMRPSLRQTGVIAGCLLLAGAVPLIWVGLNLREHGQLLVFYSANREAFHIAMYYLTPWDRAVHYPERFALLSPLILTVCVIAMFQRQVWHRPYRGVLLLVALALTHLLILSILYYSGSGPSFVERIVLIHLLMLLPLAGCGLARAWRSRFLPIRYASAVVLVAMAFVETTYAHYIIQEQPFSEYRAMCGKYEALVALLREEGDDGPTQVAAQTSDQGYFVRFRTGGRPEIHSVTAENAAELVREKGVLTLYLPTASAGYLEVDPKIEAAWRTAAGTRLVSEREAGFWRVLRIGSQERPTATQPAASAAVTEAH